jgi:hypothetical protein
MLPHRPTKPAAGRKRKRQCRYRQRTSDHPTLNQSCQWTKKDLFPYGGPGYQPSQRLQCYFPIEPAPGDYCPNLKAELGDHHSSFPKPARFTAAIFSFKQLHVALSAKVQKRHPSSIGRIKQNLTSGFLLNYLRDQTGSIHQVLLRRFRDLHSPNPNEGWKDNVWCPVKARSFPETCCGICSSALVNTKERIPLASQTPLFDTSRIWPSPFHKGSRSCPSSLPKLVEHFCCYDTFFVHCIPFSFHHVVPMVPCSYNM